VIGGDRNRKHEITYRYVVNGCVKSNQRHFRCYDDNLLSVDGEFM